MKFYRKIIKNHEILSQNYVTPNFGFTSIPGGSLRGPRDPQLRRGAPRAHAGAGGAGALLARGLGGGRARARNPPQPCVLDTTRF